MDDKIRVAIIEDSKELAEAVRESLEQDGRAKVVFTAHDGKEGLRLLKLKDVDVLLLDIILPVMDGMAVLEELKRNELRKRPVIIMLTAVSHSDITQRALTGLGADYFILKPFDMALLVRRVAELYEFRNKKRVHGAVQTQTQNNPVQQEQVHNMTMEEAISDLLHKVGIPSNLNGYTYLKSAIAYAYEDRAALDGITKILYPTVAKQCNASSVRVERSIRHAIESSWKRGNQPAYQECLGYISVENTKPTNGNFICMAVERYEQYQKSAEN